MVFCFDNECFRFLCAQKQGVSFGTDDTRDFSRSWNKAVEETFRMFQRIAELPAHTVNETLSVNNVRSVLLALINPLTEASKNRLIGDKRLEVAELNKNRTDLLRRVFVDQVKFNLKQLDYTATVCTGPRCMDYVCDSNDPNAVNAIYKIECHPYCCCTQEVQVNTLPNTALQKCWALAEDIKHCRSCGCPWSTHTHIRHRWEKATETVVDSAVHESIKNLDVQLKEAQLFIENETKNDELHKQHDMISKSCADFVSFLRTNCVLPYNLVYMDYLWCSINQAKGWASEDGSDHLLQFQQQRREKYNQQVEFLNSYGTLTNDAKSVKQIYSIIQQIYSTIDYQKSMEDYWLIFYEFWNLELPGVREKQITQVTTVDLNSGLLGKVSNGKKNNGGSG